MSLKLSHIERLILAALTLEDLVLLVAHQMKFIAFFRGKVLDGAGLYWTAQDIRAVRLNVFQQRYEAVENLWTPVARLKQTNYKILIEPSVIKR
jgi:hypothetical protein